MLNDWEPLSMEDALKALLSRSASGMEKSSAAAYLVYDERLTTKQVSKETGISTSSLRHLLRIANDLDDEVRPLLHTSRQLSLSHAKALLRAPRDQQATLARTCLSKKWSSHTLEAVLSDRATHITPDDKKMYQRLNDHIAEQTGFPTRIKPKNNQAGVVGLTYQSQEEFASICDRLRVTLDL